MTDLANKGQWLDRIALRRYADWLAIGVVATMPWSQSVFQILVALWLIALLPTLAVDQLRRTLSTPAGALPVLLWLLVVVGTLWADVPWAERLHAIGGYNKLLAMPLLFVQFRQTDRGWTALYVYLASCAALLAVSFGAWLLSVDIGKKVGVPIRDYIAQSSEFLICVVVLFWVACERARIGFWKHAIAAAALAILFLANILLVATGRTAFVVIPLLLLILGFRVYGWRGALAALVACGIAAAIGWSASASLRTRVNDTLAALTTYASSNGVSSTALRLEFWRKGLAFVAEAPIIGHGTGSTASLYAKAAQKDGVGAYVPENPHNQYLAVSIQLGIVGLILLLGFWLSHLMLFGGAGLAAWIGTVIVVQNAASSLFNSHLTDSLHGWLYVFGIGIVGGMVLREREKQAANPGS